MSELEKRPTSNGTLTWRVLAGAMGAIIMALFTFWFYSLNQDANKQDQINERQDEAIQKVYKDAVNEMRLLGERNDNIIASLNQGIEAIRNVAEARNERMATMEANYSHVRADLAEIKTLLKEAIEGVKRK